MSDAENANIPQRGSSPAALSSARPGSAGAVAGRHERIRAFDLARGLAMLFMVAVHVLIRYGNNAAGSSPFGSVMKLLGGPPAAPVFMFLMGVSLAFSRQSATRRLLGRGLGLLILAYFLNFARGTLPAFLGLRLGIITLDDISPYTPTNLLWVVDILQMAGSALIILALVRRLLPWPMAWIILSAIVAVVSPLLWGRVSGWPPLDGLLTILWGTGGFVPFPVFPWLTYPLAGMAFGVWLAGSTRPDALFRRAALAGLALLLSGTLLIFSDRTYHAGEYWRLGPGAVLAITGFVLVWLAMCHWLVKRVRANPIFNLFYVWSARMTPFYVIHWIIIGWGAGLVGYETQDVPTIIPLMAAVTVLTDLATRLWLRLHRPALSAA